MKTIKCGLAVAIVAALLMALAPTASATSNRTVSTLVGSIVADLNQVSAAAHSYDMDRLSAACSVLHDDATLGLSYSRPAAMPKAAWSHMKKAWTDFVLAAVECQQGADERDVQMITLSTSLLVDATRETNLATKIIRGSR